MAAMEAGSVDAIVTDPPYGLASGATTTLEEAIAALAAGFGQLAMTEGFRFLSVTAGSAFQMTLPLIISLGGVVFFAEHFTALQIVGGVLILAGSYQVVVKSGK
jgi:drug/metabolite transporter (DMT)-like permease